MRRKHNKTGTSDYDRLQLLSENVFFSSKKLFSSIRLVVSCTEIYRESEYREI